MTNLNDSGPGSLRDALTQSNSMPGTVVIDFQPGLTGTISLTTGHLEIVHDDWIRGPGASKITVDGNLNYWCFGVDSEYTVGAPGLHVAIDGLTMTHGEQVAGFSDSRGGAISYRNCYPYDCRLTVANCVIENSVNDGIYAEDNLSVLNCQILNNTGQGIYGGTPYVSNSWLAGNSKEGLNGFNNLVLANSTFSGNGTDGVYMGTNDATVTNCTFTGNHGRGFVINYQDTAILTNSTLVTNVGSDLLSIGGNAIPRNCIVDKLDTQNGFGTITSQGTNVFRSAVPSGMTVLASDVRSPGFSSSSTGFGGHLLSGTYYYVVGAVTAKGTLTSGDWPVSLAFTNMTVHLTWTAPVGITGVTGYQIFRGTARCRKADCHGLGRDDQPHRRRISRHQQRARTPGSAAEQRRACADHGSDRRRQRLHQQQGEPGFRPLPRRVRVVSESGPPRRRRAGIRQPYPQHGFA